VQRVSRMSFADFVEKRIFTPLDMDHSSFHPDGALRHEMATGYRLDGETPRACKPDYVNIMPAAGLCATASDMANFLVALLDDERPDGSRMFSAAVLHGLETRQFAAGPEVLGRCYGFNRVCLAGRTALRQTGQWPGFDSVLLLFPKTHCGIFLAYNLCDYQALAEKICNKFAEKFVPPPADAGATIDGPMTAADCPDAAFVGRYLSDRSPRDVPSLGFSREIDVAKSPSGDLVVGGSDYCPIGPPAFEQIATGGANGAPGGRRVMFLIGNGSLQLITQGGAYRRVDWVASTHGRVVLLRMATLVLLSAVVLWPLMAFARLIFKKPSQNEMAIPARRITLSRVARAAAIAASVLALWFEVSFSLAESRLRPFAAFYGFPAPIKHLLWALPVLILFVAVLAALCSCAWRRRLWHPAHRLHYTLLVVALGVFLYAFCSMHLLAAEGGLF
ncbi:MAG: serine hydrolase domain-containing protein, partial [Limisphaerales bacterium]